MKLSTSLLGSVLLFAPVIFADEDHENHGTETITVAAPTSPPSASYTTETDMISSALNSTNSFREEHNATALTWNTSLADAAASWASNCQWSHSGGPTGENLAIGYVNITDAIDAWGNERDIYDFNGPT